jgi:TolA-binding protein
MQDREFVYTLEEDGTLTAFEKRTKETGSEQSARDHMVAFREKELHFFWEMESQIRTLKKKIRDLEMIRDLEITKRQRLQLGHQIILRGSQ